MLAAFVTIAVLTISPAPDAPSIGGAPRSAALLQGDANRLERQLASSPILPAWAPLAAGLVFGGGLLGLAAVLFVNQPSGLAGIFHLLGWIVAGGLGALVAVIGIVSAIVMGIVNASRLVTNDELRRRLTEVRAELELARRREQPVPTTDSGAAAPLALSLSF